MLHAQMSDGESRGSRKRQQEHLFGSAPPHRPPPSTWRKEGECAPESPAFRGGEKGGKVGGGRAPRGRGRCQGAWRAGARGVAGGRRGAGLSGEGRRGRGRACVRQRGGAGRLGGTGIDARLAGAQGVHVRTETKRRGSWRNSIERGGVAVMLYHEGRGRRRGTGEKEGGSSFVAEL